MCHTSLQADGGVLMESARAIILAGVEQIQRILSSFVVALGGTWRAGGGAHAAGHEAPPTLTLTSPPLPPAPPRPAGLTQSYGHPRRRDRGRAAGEARPGHGRVGPGDAPGGRGRCPFGRSVPGVGPVGCPGGPPMGSWVPPCLGSQCSPTHPPHSPPSTPSASASASARG
jgi:hypothetical protein